VKAIICVLLATAIAVGLSILMGWYGLFISLPIAVVSGIVGAKWQLGDYSRRKWK